MRVKDLPVGDRPRERLLERGPEALADRELLALLLVQERAVWTPWSWLAN
jgi:DNA repair protein RadC